MAAGVLFGRNPYHYLVLRFQVRCDLLQAQLSQVLSLNCKLKESSELITLMINSCKWSMVQCLYEQSPLFLLTYVYSLLSYDLKKKYALSCIYWCYIIESTLQTGPFHRLRSNSQSLVNAIVVTHLFSSTFCLRVLSQTSPIVQSFSVCWEVQLGQGGQGLVRISGYYLSDHENAHESIVTGCVLDCPRGGTEDCWTM